MHLNRSGIPAPGQGEHPLAGAPTFVPLRSQVQGRSQVSLVSWELTCLLDLAPVAVRTKPLEDGGGQAAEGAANWAATAEIEPPPGTFKRDHILTLSLQPPIASCHQACVLHPLSSQKSCSHARRQRTNPAGRVLARVRLPPTDCRATAAASWRSHSRAQRRPGPHVGGCAAAGVQGTLHGTAKVTGLGQSQKQGGTRAETDTESSSCERTRIGTEMVLKVGRKRRD